PLPKPGVAGDDHHLIVVLEPDREERVAVITASVEADAPVVPDARAHLEKPLAVSTAEQPHLHHQPPWDSRCFVDIQPLGLLPSTIEGDRGLIQAAPRLEEPRAAWR